MGHLRRKEIGRKGEGKGRQGSHFGGEEKPASALSEKKTIISADEKKRVRISGEECDNELGESY